MLRQLSRLAAVIALSANAVSAQTVLFSDDMTTNVNWSIVQTADAAATFGYDYSANGIPAAPRGTNSVGLKLEVNNSLPVSVDHIIARHVDAAFTGQYTLRADIWLNWATDAAASGTTEFVGVGVGHNGTTQAPNGASFLYDSDGDTAADYRLQKNASILTTASGQYAGGANDNAAAYYADAFPAIDIATAAPSQGQTGSQDAGCGGFQWMTVNVEVDTAATGPSGATPIPVLLASRCAAQRQRTQS